jgi:class 3 adenylate cyclase/tetratricopeptide (TPR) repeat protein
VTRCSACGEENRPGRKFCAHCGSALELRCPACQAANLAGERFCGECGSPLSGDAVPPAFGLGGPGVASAAERRLVSVLFADLVGFTTLSEHRDPEEVRELLSRYFDRCRTLIERYGGTVEKFIGDAVMAVWGTPVAREDDAERAVRAALSLTQAVTALGEDVGMPELRVRAGVLTGNAAVELGAEGEGMVLGDTVNTASRLQSIASPGTVLVDDATRRASEAAIAYEDAGTHQVKGREQPVHAWTALRVVAGAGGARRSAGIEAPFVGRERELSAIIDAGEESAHERRARHITLVGEAGSGKSRLLWEYFKYLDGIQDVRWWLQGRCLSYGEGVAYWALAEMVRTRARIQEEEDARTAREKLAALVTEHVPDERERRLVEPRLAHLLRLEERPDADRADLFSGWRLFFERLSEENPVVLAFEDLQWADSGLLDFIDYLLEWSADYPIFVLCLGRPELAQRRPGWPAMTLAPLQPQEVADLLEGLAPGLPQELVEQIAERAEGIPLYAVETIRMLQDRGLLVQEGSRYHLTGDVSDLDVPETLHALVASRLDAVSPVERALLHDASVLGQSFSASAVAALNGSSEAEVSAGLDRLVTKQILGRDDDPRSPERGQYVFLQTLLRTVAYGTLSRRARKQRHVAAARHLEHTWPGEARDIVEVVAAHYLDAIRAEPDAADVDDLRASARERLSAAGRAAASLALGSEADRYFSQAAELSVDDLQRAELLELAGRALTRSGESETAESRLRLAVELQERSGRPSGGAATVSLAVAISGVGRIDECIALIEHFLNTEAPDVDPVLRARAQAMLAHWRTLRGDPQGSEAMFSEAFAVLERHRDLAGLAEAFARRAIHLQVLYRLEEAEALLEHARRLAEEHDVPASTLRSIFSLAAIRIGRDEYVQALPEVQRGLALARERGDRLWERMMMSEVLQCASFLGDWDTAAPLASNLLGGDRDQVTLWAATEASLMAAGRGEEELLARCAAEAARAQQAEDMETRGGVALIQARAAVGRGDLPAGRDIVEPMLGVEEVAGELRTGLLLIAVDIALESGDRAQQDELMRLLGELAPAHVTPVRLALLARLRAEHAGSAEDARQLELEALEQLRAVGARAYQVGALLDIHRRHGDEAALAEARTICSELGATRWLERIDARSSVTA